MSPPRCCCALWSLLPTSKWSNWFQETRSGNRIGKTYRKMESRLYKKSWNQEYQQIKGIDIQREDDQFSSGLNIIMWIVYVYWSVNITCLRSPVRIRFILFQAWLWYQRKSCHPPLPKIHESGVTTRVGDTYTWGKYSTHIR